MSVCLETSSVLASSVGTSSSVSSQLLVEQTSSNTQTVVSAIASQPSVNTNVIQSPISANVVQLSNDKPEQQIPATKGIAKLVVASHPSTGQCLQKVVNPPLITVLNPSGPLTVVKTLCVTSGVSSAPQFTLVNSTPLNVTNAVGKSPTITLLNAPVTVVKAITGQTVDKNVTDVVPNSVSATMPAIIENRGHNVFVKNTCPDSTVSDIPQSHKLLTASNFPHTNVIANVNNQVKTVNGQRSKLKILSNMVLPGTSQTPNNIILNKPSTTQRYMPRQKLIGPNGAPAKYINKPPPNNVVKSSNINPTLKLMQDKSPTRMVYPTHKSQIKTIPPVNNYVVPKLQQGIKTLSPQHKNIPGQVQRTGSGLRTIPPQRPQKITTPSANKPNYIGKHAAQAQKMRHPSAHGKVKLTGAAGKVPYNVHGPPPSAPPPPDKQLTELTFNQALTAQIIETLSNNSAPMSSNRYEILPTRYDHAFSCPDTKQSAESPKVVEDKTKSGLDALSLICQAVLLDHNYNATLPPDSPTRPSPPINITSQVNGISTVTSVYSPGSGKRRPMPASNTISSTSTMSNVSVTASNNNNSLPSRDDDAASDISDGSERKHDTEGEETDTAPEAEAVNNENFDGYGDYVTRCICGFLHDDGYMVECDRCKVWQHVQCVVKNRQVPDEFLCEVCDPAKPVDRQKARTIQQQWLRDRQFQDPKLRKDIKVKEVFKPKETISDTDSSDNEQAVALNNAVNKGRALTNRRKSDIHQKPISRQRREVAKEVVQRRQKRRERKIVKKKPKLPPKSHSDDENQDSWASHLPQLRQWIERYEEAVTNHYSPELRARISSIRVNGVHSDINIHFDSTVHKCRVHTQPLTEIKYLVSTIHLGPNTPIIELRGKYMLSTQHRNAGGSLTTRQHSQRPGPFLFFYRLHKDNTEVCVDTRTYGNSARFIRRSCKPNAELRHCIEKGVLHLYVVSITTVDKNCELTIKHESHDLAAIGTTQIACACGNPDECTVNKSTTIKKNGETLEISSRKRRGRRTVSSNVPDAEIPKPIKEEPPVSPPPAPIPPPQPVIVHSPVSIKEETETVVKLEPMDVKIELEVENPKIEIKKEEVKDEPVEVIKEEVEETIEELEKEMKIKEDVVKSPPGTPIATRRSSHYKSDKEDEKSESKEEKVKCKKLSREERKLEAILRAIEQMEKAESRKQEHQAKQAHRRESEPGPIPKEEEKTEPKIKRRKRKGRARTISQSARRNRLNSTDSYITSGDENMLSPSDSNPPPNKPSMKDLNSDQNDNRAVGLLLALSNGDNSNKHEKSPAREMDSNSNSAHSSPETQLSSACLLVQAAVEPLEPGFKFPKTKKGLMNEWLNKVPEPVQSASSISPSSLTPHINNNLEDSNSFYATPTKNLAALAQAASYCDNVQPRGNAKKRWLRQAISEDHSCDSPSSRPESPPLNDMVAPPKKRRLPRESLSNNPSPPTTPTDVTPPLNKLEHERQEGCVEIVYSGTDGDSPTQTLESDAVLKERAAKMKQEFSIMPSAVENVHRNEMGPLGCLMDPRLSRESRMFHNADLVGTVEKTLSILGLENAKSESSVPKRKVKLSITEYRQRKKLNNNDKNDEPEQEPEQTSTEENNSSESFKATPRARSGSTSSSTSITSSDDEIVLPEITTKAPAFNSEPTELERQREISRLRLKKAFGLSIDEEPRPALNVEAILNLELEPKVKPIPLPSPTFPIPGSIEVTTTKETPPIPSPSPEPPLIKSLDLEPSNPAPHPVAERPPSSVEMETEDVTVTEDSADIKKEEEIKDGSEGDSDNKFYTTDDDEKVTPPEKVVFEETESVSYVPPFNNPVYPNENFTAYTSAIDDEARYEGRNPSPPPDMEPEGFSSSNQS